MFPRLHHYLRSHDVRGRHVKPKRGTVVDIIHVDVGTARPDRMPKLPLEALKVAHNYILAAENSVGTSVLRGERGGEDRAWCTDLGQCHHLESVPYRLAGPTPAAMAGRPSSGTDIYRGTASDSESANPIGTCVASKYTGSAVVAGKTYYYVVKGVNSVKHRRQATRRHSRSPAPCLPHPPI